MTATRHARNRPGRRLATLLLALPAALAAQEHAHEHGVVRLDVAVQARTLSVQLEAPLDSVLGFEHRPRSAAERAAADAMQARLKDAAALLRPDAAAQCRLTQAEVDSTALQSTAPDAGGHADIDARYEFDCLQPERLATLDLGLFEAFPRIRRIEVQVAGTKRQSGQTLKRPARLLRLDR
jgi:hypothetical protein